MVLPEYRIQREYLGTSCMGTPEEGVISTQGFCTAEEFQ